MSVAGKAKFVGVDGCKAGWLTVGFADGAYEVDVFPTFGELVGHYEGASIILVDIPIGLRGHGPEERLCDTEARKRLGSPRSSSVFPVPVRQALRQPTYQAASQANHRIRGKKISKQTWAIAPKIAEVDDVMRTHAVGGGTAIREIHPELCFWALNRQKPMGNRKKETEGIRERVGVLERHEPRTRDILSAGLEASRAAAAADDILDALAAAVTARLGYPDSLQTVPDTPPEDEFGLPMEMVFVDPDSLQSGPVNEQGLTVTLEYCAQCGYLPRAQWMAGEILAALQTTLPASPSSPVVEAASSVDGEVISSKNATGRFPEVDQIMELIANRL